MLAVGLGMVATILIGWEVWRNRERMVGGTAEDAAGRRRRMDAERHWVTGGLMIVLGIGVMLVPPLVDQVGDPNSDFNIKITVHPVVILVAVGIELIGVVLVIAGGRRLARASQNVRSSSDDEIDYIAGQRLGRWMEGRWVCFEHDRRWCPTCSALARRDTGTTEGQVVGHDPNDHSLA